MPRISDDPDLQTLGVDAITGAAENTGAVGGGWFAVPSRLQIAAGVAVVGVLLWFVFKRK